MKTEITKKDLQEEFLTECFDHEAKLPVKDYMNWLENKLLDYRNRELIDEINFEIQTSIEKSGCNCGCEDEFNYGK